MRRLRLRDYLKPGEFCHYAEVPVRGIERVPAHTHDFFEVFWTHGASGIHWINGEPRKLTSGTLVAVTAADAHTFSGGMRMTNIAFAIDTWKYVCRRYLTGGFDPFTGPVANREFAVGADGFRQLDLLSNDLRAGARDRLATERFLLNMLGVVMQCVQRRQETSAPQWLTAAVAKMRATDNEGLLDGVELFYDYCGRSPEHVARETRRWLARTPTDLVNDIRLARAAHRLLTTNDKVLSIALECGFTNLGHFYSCFDRKYGVPPARHRRMHARIVGRG